jgi:hypothetical protein
MEAHWEKYLDLARQAKVLADEVERESLLRLHGLRLSEDAEYRAYSAELDARFETASEDDLVTVDALYERYGVKPE